jgi:hypothetical protein
MSSFDRIARDNGLVVSGITRRQTKAYPSKTPTVHSTQKKEAPRYSGDEVMGIALLHKQSYTPVHRGENPKDVSKIRRG